MKDAISTGLVELINQESNGKNSFAPNLVSIDVSPTMREAVFHVEGAA